MLRPQTGTEASDRDLEKRILNYLGRFYVQVTRRLQVEATQGFVTLKGTVRTFYHRQLCLEFAKRVDGVVEIKDALSVEADNEATSKSTHPHWLVFNRPLCVRTDQSQFAPVG